MKERDDLSSPKESVSREEYDRILSENQLLRAVLNQLPSELVVVDTELRYLFVNKAAVKDDEIREWMIGRTDHEFWERRNRNHDLSIKRREGCLEVIRTKQDLQFEESFHVGTPQEKHYVRLHRPSFMNDDQRYILVYGQDITNLKKTEEQLRAQNTELEKVNHELDQFVYSASHNLRAPLLSVKGLLGLIEDEATDESARMRFISEIHKSISRLDATIRDIIDYSKNARLPLDPVPVNIQQIIRNTHDDLRFYEGNSISLELTVEQSIPFHSDERRIKSIIHNIISNSVKYYDPQKDHCWLKINVRIDKSYCEMTFSDNGRGISTNNLHKVFDMFFRGTTDRSGSGLGLYIVKEMTERIGGKISIESVLGVGTTVRVELPNWLNS
jgi:signal transduction histidine kinase